VRTGERIQWAWDGGAANGTVTVIGDVFTAIGVPMVSGAGYRRLQFVKRPA
jgi:formylmethanofuran dehydrogenase subunit C